MEEKVIRMIIYYVLSVNDEENKTIEACLELNKLLLAMVKDRKDKADELLNLFPTGHPVSVLYSELREKSNEEIIKLLENSINKFTKTKLSGDSLKALQDDKEVENISKQIEQESNEVEELFLYDEKQKEYFAEIDGIRYTIDDKPSEEEIQYALSLAKSYKDKISEIIKFIFTNERFIDFYGEFDLTQNDILEKLNKPIIRIINENSGTVTYCNHTLDNTHIISFEFIGKFEKMAYLCIDG